MKRITIVVIVSLGYYACSRTANTAQENQADSLAVAASDSAGDGIPYEKLFLLETYLDNETTDTAKVQSVDVDCAVLIYPTEEQMEDMKKRYSDDELNTIVDDGNYYQSMAIGLLDSLNIKTVPARKSFIKFTGGEKSWTLNIRRKGVPEWNVIIYNRKKEPVILSNADLVGDRVSNYFKYKI